MGDDTEVSSAESRTEVNVETPTRSIESSPQSIASDVSSEPKTFWILSDIYNETYEVELEDELCLLGIDEPGNYN